MRARGVSLPTEVVIVRDVPGQPVLTKARPVPPLWAHRQWHRFTGYRRRRPLTPNQQIAAEVLAETVVELPAFRPPRITPSPLLAEYTTVFVRRNPTRRWRQ